MAKDTPPEMQVLGKTPSGLYVVTADNDDQRAGFLASWVQQCGFMPPAISIAIKQDRPIMRQLSRGIKFGVSLLGADDKELMGKFAKGFEMNQDPFEGSNIARTDSGTPYLAEALGYMECSLLRVLEPSTEHNLVVGEIISGKMLKEGEPWVHTRNSGEHY